MIRKRLAAVSFSCHAPQFGEHQPQHPDGEFPVAFAHHMRTEPRLLEQAHQLSCVTRMQRMVFDGSGQHLGRGVEVLWNSFRNFREFAFHRRIARDDRLPRFAAEVPDLGQSEFGRSQQRFRTRGRGTTSSP